MMREDRSFREDTATESEKKEIDITEMHLGMAQGHREHHEPSEGRERMPWWLPTLAIILLFWSGYYVGRYSGEFSAQSYDPVISGGPGKEAAVSGSPMERGATVFQSTCAACHQANGRGVPGQFPPLDGSRFVTGDVTVPIRIVLQGLSGPIQVGSQKINGNMPPWGASFNDQQIADVITYIRGSWGNKAPPVRPEQVKKVREQTKSRTTPWTAPELKRK